MPALPGVPCPSAAAHSTCRRELLTSRRNDMPDPETPDLPTKVPAPGWKPDPYGVLRNRDFRIYLSGRLVGTVGQQMFAMALGWELYERTGSALALGFVGLTQVIPMLLCTLPAGHFADIYNRKRIIVLATLIVAGANL